MPPQYIRRSTAISYIVSHGDYPLAQIPPLRSTRESILNPALYPPTS